MNYFNQNKKPAKKILFSIYSSLLVFLLISNLTLAQKKLKDNNLFISLGAMANRTIVKDKKFSAAPFSGSNAGVDLAVEYRRKQVAYFIEANISKANLNTILFPTNKLKNYFLTVNFSNIYLLFTSKNKLLNYKAGPNVQLINNKRFFENLINLNQSFETVVSLGLKFQINYKLPDKFTGIGISNSFFMPIISAIAQPAYAANVAEGQEQSKKSAAASYLHTAQIGGLNKFFNVKNTFSIEKKFLIKHTFIIKYVWMYFKINKSREVLSISNQLGIAYQYKL
jgi:hypothetical protein